MKLSDRIYMTAFLVVIFLFSFGGLASADTLWHEFTNSTLTGYIANCDGVSDDDAMTVLENIAVYEPVGEEVFGIPMKLARHRLVVKDGKVIVDDLLLIGNVGDSDTFYLSYRDDSAGVLYNVTEHWFEGLPPVLLGLYLGNAGKIGASIYGEWIIADGYYLQADLMLVRNKFGNDVDKDIAQYITNGKIAGVHNFKPDGSVYGEIFVMFIDNNPMYGGGVGFTF